MPRLAGGLVVALTLVGCDGELDRRDLQAGDAPLASKSSAVTANVCPDGATTYGIDVSKWQGHINWSQVAGDGVKYAFIRVSHGLNIIDERFAENWAGAKANGILRGVYQFFSADQDPIAQANLVLDALTTQGAGDLMPVLDVEWTDGQTPQTIASKVGQWLAHMENALGVKPLIYTGSYWWEANVNSSAYSDYPLWTPHWGVTCPSIASQWDGWLFWQYSATGSVAGISGDVDLNRFNGDLAALQALAGDPTCTANPNHAVCEGDVMVSCDASGQLTMGDCGAFGSKCSAVGGLHCVHFECWSNLDGGEDGTFCKDDSTVGTCVAGEYTESGCSGGGKCSDVGGPPTCIDAACWDNLGGSGEGTFCVDNDTRGLCTGGTYQATPCGSDQHCEVSGPGAGCVDDVVDPPDVVDSDTHAPMDTDGSLDTSATADTDPVDTDGAIGPQDTGASDDGFDEDAAMADALFVPSGGLPRARRSTSLQRRDVAADGCGAAGGGGAVIASLAFVLLGMLFRQRRQRRWSDRQLA